LCKIRSIRKPRSTLLSLYNSNCDFHSIKHHTANNLKLQNIATLLEPTVQEYDFIIHHIPGKTNTRPDILSRPPATNQGKKDNQDMIVLPPEKFVQSISVDGVPKTQKRDLMTLVHDHPTAGHPGRDETIQQAKKCLSWPGMNHWITQYMKGCAVCQQNKILIHCTKTPLYRISTPGDACLFQQISMDLITGLPRVHGKDAILTIVDHGRS
jgi:integrase-like protein